MTTVVFSNPVPSGQFWQLYYAGQIVRMHRTSEHDINGSFDDYAGGLFIPVQREFECGYEDLTRYDYADWKFSIEPSPNFSTALKTVLVSPIMDRETPVHWRQTILALKLAGHWPSQSDGAYDEWREAATRALDDADVPMVEVERQFLDSRGSGELHGLERQILIKALALMLPSGQALRILTHVATAVTEDIETRRMAVWAMGRQNNKAAIPTLLRMLDTEMEERFSVAIGKALQYLGSGDHLVPMAYEDERAHWAKHAASLPQSADAWITLDATSVFWEKRLFAARNATLSNRVRRMLQNDEVPIVRAAAMTQ